MSWLTDEQRLYIYCRKIVPDNIYMFPRFGVRIYRNQVKDIGSSFYLDLNPINKTIRSYFYAKEILENGLVRGNFHELPLRNDFYLDSSDLESREWVERAFIRVFIAPWFILKNLLRGKKQ